MAVMNPSTLTLRDYQVDCLERVHKAAARGVRRQMGVAATGLGKTVIFCALAREMGVRTLVVAHRDELIEQAAAKVLEVWPDADVGIVKGDRDEVHAKVVVASVQTLSRDKRLARLLMPTLITDAPFGLVIIDEAHHAAAASYRKLIHAMRCNEPDGPLLLGVTATPDRGDGKGLDDLFDEVVFAYDIRWGIARRYLCDLRGLRVTLDTDMSKLKVTAGDYNQGQAGQMLEDADAPNLIVKAWKRHAVGRRTLVFTPTVATAMGVMIEFRDAGVRAGYVSGAMDIDERRATLAAFSSGEIDVLCNCMVLTEGYDEPRTDCIVVARPTKSRALYTQMVGRGTRIHPEKADCLVIDVVGATEMHDLVTVPSLFGIEHPEKVWNGEGTVTEVLLEQIERHAVEGRLVAAEAQLFDKVRAGRFAWVAVHQVGENRRYELDLARDGLMVMLELDNGSWRAGVASKLIDGTRHKTVVIDHVSMETAQSVLEDYARSRGAHSLASTDAAWRAGRPTQKQRAIAKRLGLELRTGITKGEVSDMLGAHFGKKRERARKAGVK
jgi:superfamily II DNA or RNA helicase